MRQTTLYSEPEAYLKKKPWRLRGRRTKEEKRREETRRDETEAAGEGEGEGAGEGEEGKP